MGVLDFFSAIWGLITSAWNWIAKLFLKIVNFFRNIVQFFKERARLEKLKRNKKIIAATLKEKLDNGDYTVVNCLFDTEEGELVDEEIDAQIINAENLDRETQENFKGKDMMVLR